MPLEIIAALIAMVGTLIGASFGIWSQRAGRRIESMQKRNDKYRQEIRARQACEDIACQWLVELGAASTPRVAMLALRDRTEAERDVRPTMTPRDVAED